MKRGLLTRVARALAASITTTLSAQVFSATEARTEGDELERWVTGRRVQELRNERQKESRGLGIQRLDQHAFPKCVRRSGRADRFRRPIACFAKGLDAEPDQIKGADQLERRK
jgi:hypothetical protein